MKNEVDVRRNRRGNGKPWRFRRGQPVREDVTGFPTWETRVVIDDYGRKCDPRNRTFDYDPMKRL